jgi:hypothetical protein
MSDFPTRVEAIDRLTRNIDRFNQIYEQYLQAALAGKKATREEAMRVEIAVAARDAALNAFLIAVYGEGESTEADRGKILRWPETADTKPDARRAAA